MSFWASPNLRKENAATARRFDVASVTSYGYKESGFKEEKVGSGDMLVKSGVEL